MTYKMFSAVGPMTRIEKHWFIVDKVRWMRRNANHWQRQLTKTISNGNHNLIKDDDEVLTKYSTACIFQQIKVLKD